jgi:hypothetical protein
MRRVSLYDVAHIPSLEALNKTYGDAEKKLLEARRPNFEVACAAFDAAVPNVHNLTKSVAAEKDRAALSKLWEKRRVAAKRLLSEMVGTLPVDEQSQCAYCNMGEEAALDHYLPRADYPEFMLHGPNLIPICGKCNSHKSNAVKNGSGERLFLFPPYDLPLGAVFLSAQIVFSETSIGSLYHFNKVAGLDDALFGLLKRHDVRLHLTERFEKRGNAALVAMTKTVSNYTRQTALETIRTWATSLTLPALTNTWEAALKAAMINQEGDVLAWLGESGNLQP